jgi:hypothetical protein
MLACATPLQEIFSSAASSPVKAKYDLVLARRWFLNGADGGVACEGEFIVTFKYWVANLIVC